MKYSRRICFFLALTMAAAVMTACVGGGREKGDTTQTTGGEVTTETLSEPIGKTDDNLPDDLDYGNAEVKILYWSDVLNAEFDIKEQSGSLMNDAVYRRDLNVQERLGVKFVWNGQPGNKSNLAKFQQYIQNSVAAGEGNIEIVATHSMVMGALAVSGLMQDLLQTEYLDFDMPWWPGDLISNSTVRGKLYFASGDISLNTLLGMQGLFYNKDMARSDLYSYVDEGSWTLEKMIEETEGVYIDLNGDGIKNADDKYGYVTYSGMINPLFVGMGIRFVTKTAEGEIALSDTYGSEKTQGLLEKVIGRLYNTSDWVYYPKIDDCTAVFVNRRSLFYMASVRLTVNSLIEAEDLKYGILPNPKYNENQENYHTLMANTYTMYGICITVNETDMHSAVIEAMASEGYREVTPAVFETALKLRYSNTDNDSRMFDILRQTVIMETGLIFSDQLGGLPSKGLFSRVDNRSADWMSYMQSQSKSIKNYLTILNAAFGD